jgi:hypothetical protein
MIKDLSAVVVSGIVGLLILLLGMMVYGSLFPYPEGMNIKDTHDLSMFFDNLPDKALRIKVIINGIAMFCVALLATIIGRQKLLSGIIGLVIFFILISIRESKYQLSDFFTIANSAVILFTGIIGILIGLKKIR